jgi:phosphoribosylformylglycinamidine synthase I
VKTVGIVVFPGSNCEHDVAEAVERTGGTSRLIWHAAASLGEVDAVVLPGGFAHGDYLRPGAIARFSPVMAAVEAFARDGGAVVGVCNGFQVLTEAGLLPGALRQNQGLKFLCTPVKTRVESDRSVLTRLVTPGTVLELPINHFSGAYTCPPDVLAQLRAEERIILRYVDNPNGSIDDIAGVCSAEGNVVGLMPHPERACDPLGMQDGLQMWTGLLADTTASTGTSSRAY